MYVKISRNYYRAISVRLYVVYYRIEFSLKYGGGTQSSEDEQNFFDDIIGDIVSHRAYLHDNCNLNIIERALFNRL